MLGLRPPEILSKIYKVMQEELEIKLNLCVDYSAKIKISF